jgi:hypothetical protein
MNVLTFLKADFKRTNKNWKLLVVEFISGIIMIPLIIIGIAIPAIILIVPAVYGEFEVDDFISYLSDPGNLVLILISILIFLFFVLGILFIWAFVTGGVRASLRDNILEEKQFELKQFMAYGKKFFGRIVGLWSAIGALYALVFIVLGGIGAFIIISSVRMAETSEAAGIITGIIGGGVIFFILFIVGFLMAVWVAIASTVLIIEDTQVNETMKDSLKFIKEHVGHTFLVVLLLFAIGFAVGLVYAIITIPFTSIPYVGALFSLILAPVQMALNLYLNLFGTTGYMFLYLMKKKRLEGDFQTITSPL